MSDENIESTNEEVTVNTEYVKIFNLGEEIKKIAIAKEDVENEVKSDSDNPVKSSAIYNTIANKVNQAIADLGFNSDNYYTKTEINEKGFLNANDVANNYFNKGETAKKYVTKDDFKNHKHPQSVFNMYNNPETINVTIDNITTPGYYQYVNDSNVTVKFYCTPDDINYKNGLISVEKANKYYLQRVYATTDGQDAYLNGKIFKRIGIENDEGTKVDWKDWQVEYIPYKERSDLIKHDTLGTGVSHFTIYESTAGYTFEWNQSGVDNRYVLQAPANKYDTIAEFQSLPISDTPFIFGNLIGHIDVKITQNSFQVRSINNKGDYVVGVNTSFFVPRTN